MRATFSRGILLLPLVLGCVLAGAASGEGRPLLLGAEGLRQAVASPWRGADVVLFGNADFLGEVFLPLSDSGAVGSVTVVLPAERPLGSDEWKAFRAYAGSLVAGSGDAFSLDNGAVSGRLKGLPVRIVPVSLLRGLPATGPVVLDLGFLVGMYRDENRTPFVDLPLKFLATLQRHGADASRVAQWVPDRTAIPLERGYLPKLVAAALRDPASFRRGLPPKWQALKTGEQLDYLAMYEQANFHFERYLKEEPEDPAVLFRIAQGCFVDRDIERGLRFLHRAYRADPYYLRGYSGAAVTLYRKGGYDDAGRILQAGLHASPDDVDMKAGLARVYLGQALKMLPVDPAAADARYAESASLGLPAEFMKRLDKEWEDAKAAPAPGKGGPPGMPRGHGSGGHGR